MRLFVTGGTGFIGKALCAALAGHELLILSRQPAPPEANRLGRQHLTGDLYDIPRWRAALGEFRAEACIHLAWSDLPDYSYAASKPNFKAGLKLFKLLREVGCGRVVVTGTCFEYGNLTGQVTEDQFPLTLKDYPAFKTAQRRIGSALFAEAGVPFLWARPFFVYGAGQRATSLIPSTFAALTEGRLLDIRTPDTVNDFVHVDDVASALARLATRGGPAGVYNIGTGRATRVRDVVNGVARLLNRPEVFPPSNSPGQGYWADLSRIRQQIGWEPAVALDDGIRQTLAAWQH